MSEVNGDLKKLNEEFNKAGNVPAGGFSKEDLKSHPKVQATKRIIEQAQKDIERKASTMFNDFKVEFKISSSDNSSLSEDIVNAINFDFSGDGEDKKLQVAINFNFSKLSSFSPEIVYSVAYKTMYDSMLKKRDSVSNQNNFKFGKESDLKKETELESNEPRINDANFDRQGNYVAPQHPIFEFVKKVIYKLLGVSEVESAPCAKEIEYNFIQSGIKPEDMFANPDGANLLVEHYGKVVKKGYDQQATALLGVISKDEFNSLKSQDDSKLMAFCDKYSRILLATNGIDAGTVQITFNNQGAMGEYLDYGGMKQVVNININKVKSMNNPAEVVMTLSHELTHAIDSTKNKLEGKTVGAQGYGLTDNLVGDTRNGIESASSENREVYDYVKRLQEICYRINPNERSARYGELAAIKFMQGMNPDKTMQNYINNSIDSYKSYQDKVLNSISQIDGLESEYMKIKSQISSSSTVKMIEDRLNYISSLNQRNMLDPEQEKKSVEIALDIKDKIASGEKDVQGVEMSAGE